MRNGASLGGHAEHDTVNLGARRDGETLFV